MASRKIITFVAYNRPIYTADVLRALERCEGIEEYTLFVHLEPGCPEVRELFANFTAAEIVMTVNGFRFGIGKNTYRAWQHGFSKADFIVHCEDDTVPAPDCLRMMEHCDEEYRCDANVFSVASYERNACPLESYHRLSRRCGYTCWLIGLWRNRWEWASKSWSPDPRRYATHLADRVIASGWKEIHPLLSRCQNIGAEGGVHVPSAEWHRIYHHTNHWAGDIGLRSGVYSEQQRNDH